MSKFEDELRALVNKYSLENDSDTPDFLLARYMCQSLDLFQTITRHRDHYYGRSRKTEIQAPNGFSTVNRVVIGGTDRTVVQVAGVEGFGDIKSALAGLSIRQTGGEFKESSAARVAALGERTYTGTGNPNHPYDRPDSFWDEQEAGVRSGGSAPYIEP